MNIVEEPLLMFGALTMHRCVSCNSEVVICKFIVLVHRTQVKDMGRTYVAEPL
jgi:hypothetical protein